MALFVFHFVSFLTMNSRSHNAHKSNAPESNNGQEMCSANKISCEKMLPTSFEILHRDCPFHVQYFSVSILGAIDFVNILSLHEFKISVVFNMIL